MKGKIIVVEGACDGIGKTTQFNLLEEYLLSKGLKVAKHHFPTYDTDQGKLAQNYLAGIYGNQNTLSPYFINCLYAVDRAITWNNELKEKCENGETILLDRYTTSSLIYQSSLIEDIEEKKKFLDYICDFEYSKLGIAKPDKVIFLTAPFELVMEMKKARKANEGISNDIHERDLEFMKKVYDNAMLVADYLHWDKIECGNITSMKSIDEIHNLIINTIK